MGGGGHAPSGSYRPPLPPLPPSPWHTGLLLQLALPAAAALAVLLIGQTSGEGLGTTAPSSSSSSPAPLLVASPGSRTLYANLAVVLALLAAYAALLLAGRRRAACSAMCCGTLLLELLRLGSALPLSSRETGQVLEALGAAWRLHALGWCVYGAILGSHSDLLPRGRLLRLLACVCVLKALTQYSVISNQ
mmetsp:Transcript_2773/g.9276  ORF Transcript_2773/g.9276 Transcript_2773/m.9276 type:complete len:191 (+) Transcript_2773:1196-1768(+)